jgi:hypothetical protein
MSHKKGNPEMAKPSRGDDPANVNVTLQEKESTASTLAGRKFPCQLCGAGLEIRISRTQKPYTVCLECGIQNFYRGKQGIQRLRELLDSHLLMTGTGSVVDTAILLFNRIQGLRAQKKELKARKGLIFHDSDLENAILVVDNEMERVQGELKRLGRKTGREKKK